MSASVDRLVEIMAALRDRKDGCPWDVEQTFATIAPYTIEEAYEVADAIDRGDLSALRDELGDLLLQVVFHAQMAKEAGAFDIDDVARAICDKLVRRHPHVFGGARIDGAAAQTRAWEEHKARERGENAAAGASAGALDGIAVGLPALTRALKLQARAARVGFDWADAAGVVDKLDEEAKELRAAMAGSPPEPAQLADEIGDLLFTCVNLARKLGIDPEAALRRASGKFESRFRRMERLAAAEGRSLREASASELEALWMRAKAGD
jgi:ATP diphosphatase